MKTVMPLLAVLMIGCASQDVEPEVPTHWTVMVESQDMVPAATLAMQDWQAHAPCALAYSIEVGFGPDPSALPEPYHIAVRVQPYLGSEGVLGHTYHDDNLGAYIMILPAEKVDAIPADQVWRQVWAHELGHAFGLGHVDYGIMNIAVKKQTAGVTDADGRAYCAEQERKT